MTASNRFSIIIPTLNEETTLPELLGDLKQQIFKDFEVIVVDGRSEDKTKIKVVEYNKILNLQFIESKVRDVSYQRNLGVSYAASEWIIFMDADDRLKSNFLKTINDNLLKKKNVDVFSCWMLPDSNNLFDWSISLLQNIGCFLTALTSKPAALGSMIGVKNAVFEKIGGFKEKAYSEDWDFIINASKMGCNYRFFVKPSYITSFRRFRKYGRIKVIFISIRLTTKRLLHVPIDRDNEWPMGKY